MASGGRTIKSNMTGEVGLLTGNCGAEETLCVLMLEYVQSFIGLLFR